jgi:hypothetical protein
LWIVAREGGDARQLTTGVGIETDPVFSPPILSDALKRNALRNDG